MHVEGLPGRSACDLISIVRVNYVTEFVMSISALKADSPRWHGKMLKVAAAWSIFSGLYFAAFPELAMSVLQVEPQTGYAELWRYLGITLCVYGVGYWCASYAPVRHSLLVMIGLLGKILGPIGFLLAARNGSLPILPGIVFLANSLIWSIPFTAVLLHAWRSHHASKLPSQFVYSSMQSTAAAKRRQPGAVVRMTVRAASDT